MERSEKLRRIKRLLHSFTSEGSGLESLRPSTGEETLEAADPSTTALHKLDQDEDDKLEEYEVDALEAIILPGQRPVAFVVGGVHEDLTDPWTHLNTQAVKDRLGPAMASIGRVELPNSTMPYGGTGFVVGDGLVMTNRHVARLFTHGVGQRQLVYRPGDAALDFLRERDSPEDAEGTLIDVRSVVMVHPYWDMALLRVDGLEPEQVPLVLDVRPCDDLAGTEVVTVGYPAQDPRNAVQVQNRVFGGVYYVKRLQPGKIGARREFPSFGHDVLAMTHDSSTLGGNSGSAVIDVATGRVVALHFAGRYLDANFGVPAYELARDAHVVDAGVRFDGTLAPTTAWHNAWAVADKISEATNDTSGATNLRVDPTTPTTVDAKTTDGAITLTVPLKITISLGEPSTGWTNGDTAPRLVGAPPRKDETEWPSMVPKIYPRLGARRGYWEGHLYLPGGQDVEMPRLTDAGRESAASLEDGTFELKYHKFSIVMHKQRRLALFTAANIDWRKHRRELDGHKPTRRELTGLPEGTAEEWVNDPRIADEHQLPDVFFTEDRASFDKGHLVRRDDVVWGTSFAEMQKANGDTYHVTNCSPQTAAFNRASRGVDNWGDLENLVQKQTKQWRAVTFAGPVFTDDDPVFTGEDLAGPVRIEIPRSYWKIIVVRGEEGPEAYGFVLEQNLDDVDMEFTVPQRWRSSTRTIAQIEALCGGLLDLSHLLPFDRHADA